MPARYCYFCDAPADRDPCPTCGKPIHTPEKSTPLPADRPPAVVSSERGERRAPVGRWVVWVVAVAVAVIIVLLLRSPFGI